MIESQSALGLSLDDTPLSSEAEVEAKEALDRLLCSHALASAPRLREVLTYLLESAGNGSIQHVTEQSIGRAVFGRPEGYNASEDNIVRVTVRHLRARLETYYSAEGRDETYGIEIPKGKYFPVLIHRGKASRTDPLYKPSARTTPEEVSLSQTHLLKLPEDSVLLSPHVERTSSRDTSRTNKMRFWLVVSCLACLACGYFLRGWFPSRGSGPHAAHGILGVLGDTPGPVMVIVTDSNLQAYRMIFGKQVSLQSYIARTYAPPVSKTSSNELAGAIKYVTASNETNVSSAIIAADIRAELPNHRVTITQPHDASMRDFQEQKNVVLLGGPWINPWGQLFESRLKYRLFPIPGNPSASELHVINPDPNEPKGFIPRNEGGYSFNYVRIAILPNFSSTGRVFVVGATSPEALEAGGNILASDQAMHELLERFHVRSLTELNQVEFVLEVKGMNSVPADWRIVATNAQL